MIAACFADASRRPSRACIAIALLALAGCATTPRAVRDGVPAVPGRDARCTAAARGVADAAHAAQCTSRPRPG